MNILKLLFFAIIGIMSYMPLMAEGGFISGKIVDGSTGEELIGAVVLVEGTAIGTVTDFDGNYTLELDTGIYNISYSYISYQTQFLKKVHISKREVIVNDVILLEDRMELAEVVIVARPIGDTEATFQVMRKKSPTVIDGISSEQISKLDVTDAAEALKLVTGVSVTGGKYVYVRGLSDRYSLTTLNGAQIPGLDPDRNTVQMDLFPSNIIENIVVHKTFSPELPASFTGGYVDIVTRDFPERLNLQFSASWSYNPQNNFNNEFLTYSGGKYDWLGFDDGTRSIPVIAKDQIPPRFVDDQKLDEITKSFNKVMEPVNGKSFIDQSYSFGIGNQVKIRKVFFGYNVGLSYSNRYRFYGDGVTGRYKLVDAPDQTLTGQLTIDEDIKGSNEVLWSVMASGNFKFSNSHKIGLYLLHNQSGESLSRYQEGEKASDESGMFYQTRTLQYLERGFTSGQIKGKHYFDNFIRLKIDWFSSLTFSSQAEPDLRFFTNHYTQHVSDGTPMYEIAQSLYPVPTRYYRNMNEVNLDNKLNAEIPINFFDRELSKIRIGASYLLKDRDFKEQKFMFNENSNSYNGNVAEYLDDSNMNAAEGKLHVTNSISSNDQNSYTGHQAVLSLYGMTDLNISQKFRLTTGVRMEKAYIETRSYRERLPAGILNNLDFLPSINFTYHPRENMNLRLAYNRTLARPSFRELAPYASLNFVGDYVFVGNAMLERTLIDNADLRWEYFFAPGEMVSVGGFYKNFINPIERTFNTEAVNPELTLRNLDYASVVGVEFEFRKKLDFIPILKNFIAGGNITVVKSSVTVDAKELQLKRELDPDFSAKRVMMGQAPYIINTFLTYTNEKSGVEVNVSYNKTGESLYLINAVGVPDVYLQPRGQFDANIAKSFGEHFQIRFSVLNILNDPYRITYPFNGVDYLYESYSLNRTFRFTVKYAIR